MQQQLVVRISTHRTLEKHDAAAVFSKLINQHHLMDKRAREPIGGGDQHHLKGGKGGMVAQPVQTRAIELCAAVAIVAIDMLLGQVPVGISNNVSAQALELLLNRLSLVLARA